MHIGARLSRSPSLRASWQAHLVLAGAKLVHQQGAPLGVLPAVEAVQLHRHLV